MSKLVRFILTTLLRSAVVLSVVGTVLGAIVCLVEGSYYLGGTLLILLLILCVGAVTYYDFYTHM